MSGATRLWPSDRFFHCPFCVLGKDYYHGAELIFQDFLAKGGVITVAQRVNVVLVDDIDGSDAEETVRFALDGVSYEIDLTSKHAGELRNAVALYTGHARKVGGRGAKGQRALSDSASAAEIRQWARENGWDVPDRGRVATEVREAYSAAH